ncbi:1-acyl-sn-glycerol-3-phosphate acyltransferase [Candidatus Riesia pediculischaeffi]|uniref:Glycerol-3-phosphate acyltransferase n=1 Tax=Candidatus Riesia pediculischaeffi TaxID=428411 RepID=A0A1V0HK02_9ENTR|nr:1-acyl-sn-glycerol-3-phosphate acyltransferase [Candidatus Riesia pediculischaeffi]ARC53158.1 hypothetical protein AOQ87_00360 [Candidatus Riesia pediculischaeffi]
MRLYGLYLFKKIHFKIFQILRTFFFKNTLLPEDPVKTFNLNTEDHFLYILPYHSTISLSILQHQCSLSRLSDPFKSIIINGKELPSCLFIKNKEIDDDSFCLDREIISIMLKSYLHPSIIRRRQKIQILFVSIVFHKIFHKKIRGNGFSMKTIMGRLYEILFIILFKRRSWTRIYLISSLQDLFIKSLEDQKSVERTIKAMMMKYFNDVFFTVGPNKFLHYHEIFRKMRLDRSITNLIKKEAEKKMVSVKKIEKYIISLIREMISNTSSKAIYLTDIILKFILEKIYKNIYIYNINDVYKISNTRNIQLIYVPSHKSHMDYLVLSYILYQKGMMVPYIIAGINLKFWPIGFLFKKLGAVFIHRSFKKSEIYIRVFQKCFDHLMLSGRSIEYFIEGGRSRTGLLLSPKTGILSTIIKYILKNHLTCQEIAIIPVHITYDKIIELPDYIKEVKKRSIKKERFLNIFQKALKFYRFKSRFSYINFGDPILLKNSLLRKNDKPGVIHLKNDSIVLNEAIEGMSIEIMTRINDSISVNSVNLCAIVLSYISNTSGIKVETLTSQVKLYLDFLRNVPYSKRVVVPKKNPRKLVKEFFMMQKFQTLISLKEDHTIFLTKDIEMLQYYKNNIIHLFILPSFISKILLVFQKIKIEKIHYEVISILPIMKDELFLNYKIDKVSQYVNDIIEEFVVKKIILINSKNHELCLNKRKTVFVKLFSQIAQEISYKYFILLFFLNSKSNFDLKQIKLWISIFFSYSFRSEDIKNIIHISNRRYFIQLLNILFKNEYLKKEGNIILVCQKTKNLYRTIFNLIPREIYSEMMYFRYFFFKNSKYQE